MTNPVIPMQPTQREDRPAPARIFLQPIAAPSILGLYGFSLATFIVAANMAGWFGGLRSAVLLAPFAAMFGGLAQFTAGMWAFKARDGLATAIHGLWGAFWLAYGLLSILLISGALTVQGVTGAPALGWWIVVMAATTWVLTAAAAKESRSLSWFLGLLALGSTLAFIGEFASSRVWVGIAGYFLLAASIVAWVIANSMVLREAGYSIFGAKEARERPANVVVIGEGEPGVIRGQA